MHQLPPVCPLPLFTSRQLRCVIATTISGGRHSSSARPLRPGRDLGQDRFRGDLPARAFPLPADGLDVVRHRCPRAVPLLERGDGHRAVDNEDAWPLDLHGDVATLFQQSTLTLAPMGSIGPNERIAV